MVLGVANENGADAPASGTAAARGKKTVEQTYTKLSQLEHVLVRPDTYVGSVERMQQTTWVWDEENKRMSHKEISYPPGLYKIFDEILVNAADHAQRDPRMDCLKVEIDQENQVISVWNNGSGIPVEMHKKEKMYVPELIFGNLLTSSNYDDNEKKVVGGRNGFGAKLANIFSTQFTVETADAVNGKRYKQVFRDNMTLRDDPIIRTNPRNEAFTKITFSPDLKRFGMTAFDDDIVSLLKKRVYDIAGVNTSTKVYLNGVKLNIKSFKDYVALYPSESEGPIAHERLDDRWEVAITASDGQLNQVSFVNSIWTIKGGTHVTHVADAIMAKIADHIQKKNKGLIVKPFQIKSHLSLFINCLVENPSFDSQTKETLTTKPAKFGSKWSFTDELAKKVMKSDIIDNVLAFARFKQDKELAKTDGGKKTRLIGIAKLADANKAGGREASKCTLILTEGDSAMSTAVSGLSVVGRDYYGVFPLRGKLLNVREAKHKQIMDNAEINNLKKIIGLQHGKQYDVENVKSLRYGHILIMTDQDHDGSHIKGLVINLFDHFWPTLLLVPGFIQELITPIVKCVKGRDVRAFFTIPQYKEWTLSNEGTQKGWKPKYYKGLGTSTAADAKGYFSNLSIHLHNFKHEGEEDSDMISLAFSKQRVNDRKDWLSAFVPGTFFDFEQDELNYSNFVNKELILFSMADNSRSIPNMIDGFKPSQRKVLFGCFKRRLTKSEIKVQQLTGYVSEQTAYHHGDVSLQATIVGLAQNFVGSNNMNLLVPAGQFGTRLLGGKDAASARYIFTKLAPIARALIPEVDDALLSYLEDDGLKIEPKWYCPIIPLILVNGSDGIGTGWSSFVPCYNPRDLIQNIRNLLAGEPAEKMSPWYRGFNGSIVPVENMNSYDVYGTVRRGREENTFKVDELPIRSWTTPYKEFLESSVIGVADAKTPFVKDFHDNSTESKVNFTFSTTNEHAGVLATSAAYKRLKLSTTLSTNNMVLFDAEGRIRKYETSEEIIQEFFHTRLALYDERRAHLLRELEKDLLCLDNKKRFIMMVIDGKLRVAKRKKAELVGELKQLKFDPIFNKKSKVVAEEPVDIESDNDNEEDVQSENHSMSEKETGYDYLLSMALWSLTVERVKQLGVQRDNKEAQKKGMEAMTGTALWERDLQNLEMAMEKDEAETRSQAKDLERVAQEARNRQRRGGGGGKRKGAKAVVYEDMEDDDDMEMVDVPTVRTVVAKVPRARKLVTAGTGPKSEPKTKAEAGKKKAMAKKSGRRVVGELLDVDNLLGDAEDDEDLDDFSEYSEGDDDDRGDDSDGGDMDMEGGNSRGIAAGLADISLGDGEKKTRTRTTGRARRAVANSTAIIDDDSDDAIEDEFEVGDGEDDEEFGAKKKVNGTRPQKVVSDIADDVDEITAVKPAPRAARGRKKTSVRQAPTTVIEPSTPPPAPKPAVNLVSSDEEVMSLSARLNKRLSLTRKARSSTSSTGSNATALEDAPVAVAKPAAQRLTQKTRSSISSVGSSTMGMEDEPTPIEAAVVKPAAAGRRKGRAAATTTAVKRGTVSKATKKVAGSVSIELSPGKSPAAKKTRVRGPAKVRDTRKPRGRPVKKAIVEDSEEEEEDGAGDSNKGKEVKEVVEVEEEQEEEEVVAKKVAAAPVGRGRPKRAVVRKVVIEENSDEEDDDDSVEFVDDDDDDSDFE